MKRTTIVISILVAMSMLFTACAPKTSVITDFPRNETLYITGAAWGPPSTWNPFQPGSLANTTGTIGLLYETLFGFDPMTGEMTPMLAESGNWSDATTYEVVLRQGMTWSDGKALTADDVVFTYELGQKYAAIWFSSMWDLTKNGYLTGVTAVDATHLRFTFDDPLYQEFANNLYNIPIVPRHLWENRTEEEITTGTNENPVGSGAFLFYYGGADRKVWERNDNWWGLSSMGTPPMKWIVEITTSGNAAALGLVLKGELDMSNNFLPGVAEMVKQGYVTTYYSEAPYMLSANTAVLFLNTTKKPMDDPAFRKALAFSINVQDIIDVAYAGLVQAANPTALLPALSKYVDRSVVSRLGFTYDPNQSATILADAGYVDVDGDGFVEAPDGSKIALEVTCPNGWTDWMAAINVIANSAQAAGINVTAVTPDYGAWNDALLNATFDMTLNNWANLSNTPWTVYNLLFNHPLKDVMQSGNFGKYDNQEMFDLVDALARIPMSDEAAMKAACSDIQEKMLTDVPMIPLWYNGLWSQYSNAVWTNWPIESSASPTLPTSWSGYWQLGGLQTLINLQPVPVAAP